MLNAVRLPRMLTPAAQEVDQVKASFLRWLESGDNQRRQRYRLYRRYYEGDHDSQLTDRMRKFLAVAADIEFTLNFCAIPVDVLAERLVVTGFDVKHSLMPGVEEPDEEPGGVPLGGEDGLLWSWWVRSRMDAQQGDVHQAVERDGDTYLLVEWDSEAGLPRFSHEQAFDGSTGVEVIYSDERPNDVLRAIKYWRAETGQGAGEKRRANVYTPDAIYRYVSDGEDGAWRAYMEESDAAWPVPWPVGIVPVVHFGANRGGYDYGKSGIHDVVPIQRAINKTLIDLLGAADVAGFQLITLSGGDPNDEITVAPRQVLATANEAARWGNIPEGDLTGLISTLNNLIMKMAQVTRTPLAYFQVTGQVASAETQRADDTGLVAKAERRAVEYGNAWENVMHIAVKLYNAFGSGPAADESLLIETVWGNFDRVDKMAVTRDKAEIVQLLGNVPGVDVAGVMDWLEIPDEAIQKMLARRVVSPLDALDPQPMIDEIVGGGEGES